MLRWLVGLVWTGIRMRGCMWMYGECPVSGNDSLHYTNLYQF